MKPRRHDSKPGSGVVRTTRFIETEEGWFFRTREGIMLGPYDEQFDAEISASLLIARLAQLEPGADAAPTIQRFTTDPANAPLVNASATPDEPVDLGRIKRRHRIQQSIPTFQKAWQALVNLRSSGRASVSK